MAGNPRVTGTFSQLASLYSRMEKAYDESSRRAGLNCTGCVENCCTSYFKHHTYIEWIYFLKGIRTLPAAEQQQLVQRAQEYKDREQQCLASNTVPDAMCPVNKNGRCSLYAYRLMICRMHGTKNSFTAPDGKTHFFQGCNPYAALAREAEQPTAGHSSCQETGDSAIVSTCITGSASIADSVEGVRDFSPLDRTPFYKELASLEMHIAQKAGRSLPRVAKTIADMILEGPPQLR